MELGSSVVVPWILQSFALRTRQAEARTGLDASRRSCVAGYAVAQADVMHTFVNCPPSERMSGPLQGVPVPGVPKKDREISFASPSSFVL